MKLRGCLGHGILVPASNRESGGRVFQYNAHRLISPPRSPTHGTLAVSDILMLSFIVVVVIAAIGYAWLCQDI
ncbi:MAG: hypothetical protein ABSA58_03575 [Acetobacteraceae bacterium]